MNKYNYLFYGGTWYDIKVKAFPLDPSQRDLYIETKDLYTDPSVKQPFDFRNPLLQKELNPIYEQANTWKEFADALHEKYDKELLCRKIAPWYSYALAILTKNRMLPEYWAIDISSFTPIPFTRFPSSKKSGRIRKYYAPRKPEYNILSPGELYSKSV